MFLGRCPGQIYFRNGLAQFAHGVVAQGFTYLTARQAWRTHAAKGVKPVHQVALRVEDSQVDIALFAVESPAIEFLPPDLAYGCGYVGVIAVAVPGGGNERAQCANYLRIDERGPTDLCCSGSAVSRGEVAVLRVDNDQKYRTFFE